MGDDDYAGFDATEIRAMHYMMLGHDHSKSPGRYRKGPIYVRDERRDEVVYEGPDAAHVPELVEALVESLHTGVSNDPVVRSAMAHLNLVMIHPFRHGNGRMARALATSVLTRSDIGEPEFSSIEEWLGANTEDYYSVLAHTGRGSWQPRDDAHLWLTFNLRAHHMQAQTVARRVEEADATWIELDRLVTEHDLPDRVTDAMFDAVLGYRVRRATYLKRAEVTDQTATRDLAALASEGILMPHGSGRGRFWPKPGCSGVGESRHVSGSEPAARASGRTMGLPSPGAWGWVTVTSPGPFTLGRAPGRGWARNHDRYGLRLSVGDGRP